MTSIKIASATLLSILLVSCWSVSTGQEMSQTGTGQTGSIPNSSPVEKDAVKKPTLEDISICDSKTDLDKENCRTDFITQQAIKDNKLELCQNITVTSLQETCRKNVLFSQAITKKDPSLCDGLVDKNLIGNCYSNIQMAGSSGSDSCASITDEEIKNSCNINLILKEAASKGDPTICESLTDEKKLAQCKDSAYFSEAIAKKDSSVCVQVRDNNIQDACKKLVGDRMWKQ